MKIKNPKKRERKDQWISKIRRDEGEYFAVPENTRVCSKHFCEDTLSAKMEKARRQFWKKVLFQLFFNGLVKNNLGVL